MLIARLLTRLKEMQTLQVFLLEILAVFIGISASLFVDDWRQKQQDREILDHLMQATHYNALQDQAYVARMINAENLALENALTLLYDDLAVVSDEDLIDLFDWATIYGPPVAIQTGYQRLINTSLSIPFDHTMAELDYLFMTMRQLTKDISFLSEQIVSSRRRLRAAAGMPEDSRNWSMDFVDASADKMNAVLSIVNSRSAYLTNINDAGAIREASQLPHVRELLLNLVTYRYQLSYNLISFDSFNDQVINSIRLFDPDITLPVAVIELTGGATSVGWSDGMPMRRDERDPNLWRIRAELSDGPVKFRADGSFASNWGTADLPENRAANVGFGFGGDPATVFPRGVAEFVGLNIPVTAGIYDVTFNTRTFEYSFERVDSGGEADD